MGQWEYCFARHHKKNCLVYLPNRDYVPDEPKPSTPDEDAASQAAFVAMVEKQHEYGKFGTADALCRAVGAHQWPPHVPGAGQPVRLPYRSLGPLFKGRTSFLNQLQDSLNRPGGGSSAIAGLSVHGLGGVGKTRCAVEYAWSHRSD